MKVNLPALLTVLIGVGLTSALYVVLTSWEEERQATEFANRAANETDALKWSMENYCNVFAALADVPLPEKHGSDLRAFIDLKDFQALLAPPALASLPGLRVVAWVPRVQAAQRLQYEQLARASDFPGFEIVEAGPDGTMVRAGNRKVYYPVHHWSSRESRTTVAGFDLGTDPGHLEALKEARRTGRAAVFMQPEIFTPEGGLTRFEIMQPIYRPGALLDAERPEPADLLGYVVGLFSMHDSVRAALGGQDDPEIQLRVYYGSVFNGELVYDQDAIIDFEGLEETRRSRDELLADMHLTSSVNMPGQAWSLLSYPTLTYQSAARGGWTVWQIAAAGLLVSIVLGAYMWVISNRNEFVARLVDERTRQLRRANEELEVEVAERTKTQQELRKVSQAVEQSANMVVITDARGHIEYVNPKFVERMGFAGEDVAGQSLSMVRSKQTVQETFERICEAIDREGQWRGDFNNQTKDGKIISVATNISPIRNAQGAIEHYVSVEEDITEQKRLEEQFLQAQKMEIIGRLVGGIAHDFNNILTTILGFGQMFLRKVEADHWMRPGLEELVYAAERASNLTKQLLTFARKREREAVKTVLNLTSVVQGMNKLVGRTLGEDIDMVMVCEEDETYVYGDQTQIEQIVMNLAVNARDAMPRGGKLVVRTTVAELDGASSRGRLVVEPGTYAVLSISDTGVGMSEEVIEHVFEPFYTTKELGKGTGLGLSTVFGIVKQMGGDIEILSKLEEGTEFRVYMPLAEIEMEEGSGADMEKGDYRGQETILVVEDDDSVRRITVASLKELGYEVREARDGAEALSICEKSNGSVDLIFTDIVMPNMSGPDLVSALTERNLNYKVVYTSGFSDHPSLKRTTELKGTNFIEKPFSLELLSRTIRDVLDAA